MGLLSSDFKRSWSIKSEKQVEICTLQELSPQPPPPPPLSRSQFPVCKISTPRTVPDFFPGLFLLWHFPQRPFLPFPLVPLYLLLRLTPRTHAYTYFLGMKYSSAPSPCRNSALPCRSVSEKSVGSHCILLLFPFRVVVTEGHLCPGDPLNPGIEPTSLTSPALAGTFFNIRATWEAQR